MLTDNGNGTTNVEMLTDNGDCTTNVEITHTGFGTGGNWDKVQAYFDRAWKNVLAALADRYAK